MRLLAALAWLAALIVGGAPDSSCVCSDIGTYSCGASTGHKCVCHVNFWRPACNSQRLECFPSECGDKGHCVFRHGGYECDCDEGFWGRRCEHTNASVEDLKDNDKNLRPKHCEGKKECDPPHLIVQCSSEDLTDCDENGNVRPYKKCPYPWYCYEKFRNGVCDWECERKECLYDGFDCATERVCPDACKTQMDDRIFFKDKANTLKGPYTEHKIQEWYRKGWFESSFPFYFTRSNERPSDGENSGMTLDSLRSFNGFGCPFVKVDEEKRDELEKKRIDREERLERIEKEIDELHQKYDVVLNLEKAIYRMENKLEELAVHSEREIPKSTAKVDSENCLRSDSKTDETRRDNTTISKPDSIPEDIWQSYYQLGSTVVDFVLDTFEVYATGQFASWDMERMQFIESALSQLKGDAAKGRNLVCEHILVERMKKKEFFCCFHCYLTLFNYKQALIHFMSNEHREKVPEAVGNSIIDDVVRIVNSFTKLPSRFLRADEKLYMDYMSRREIPGPNHRPSNAFMISFTMKYTDLAAVIWNNEAECHSAEKNNPLISSTITCMNTFKSEIGRKAMAELHEHLEASPTYCPCCDLTTGDREGYYRHAVSFTHMTKTASELQLPPHFCLFTSLINVYRKDLI